MAELAFSHGPDEAAVENPALHPQNPPIPQVALLLIGALALLLRHRHPRTVAVVTTLCGAALPFIAPHTVVIDVATIVALYTVAAITDRRTAAILGILAAVLLTASSIRWLPNHFSDLGNLLPINYIAVAVAVGDAVRNQHALLLQERRRTIEAEHSRESEARRQVREERVRIARELHDVVAHHITLVNAQAGVAHHLLRTDPERAYQALAGIKETSRAALDELRATVGLLRADDEPESLQPVPTFAEIGGLIESFRTAGLHIQLTQHGTPRPMTGSADLAAYRIVQEALTNASKHSIRAHTDVDLKYTQHTLTITVTNPATHGRSGPGTGHGLIGMRERAESAGGHLTATLQANTSFVVTAILPLTANDGPAL
ncbi:sensor histidine kinase [Dactylosporangium darangshiense]